jgi:hypothetical protein
MMIGACTCTLVILSGAKDLGTEWEYSVDAKATSHAQARCFTSFSMTGAVTVARTSLRV